MAEILVSLAVQRGSKLCNHLLLAKERHYYSLLGSARAAEL